MEDILDMLQTTTDYNDSFSTFKRAVENKNESLINSIISKDSNMPHRIFGSSEETLLHIVAKFGTVETATKLIKLGSDVNAQNKYGETPLFYAATNSAEMFKVLINNSADVKIHSERGMRINSLQQSLILGSVERVQLVLNKALPETIDDNLSTNFLENFDSNNLQHCKNVIELLLNHKTHLNLTEQDYPLLIFFAAKIADEEVFKLVVNDCKKFIDCNRKEEKTTCIKKTPRSFFSKFPVIPPRDPQELNYPGHFGRTALHYAVKEQFPEVVRFLLNHGADPNVRTGYYYTPLHYACCRENEEIIKILLSFGADVNAKFYKNTTPLHLVCGCSEFKELLPPAGELQYEERHSTFKYRMNPLYKLKPVFNLEIMKLLLANGADTEILGENGTTPFLEACREGHVESAKLLLSFGASLKSLNKEENTALHYAAAGNCFEIVDLLLKKGFDIETRNKKEYTPLLFLAQYERADRLEMIEYLVDYGANINAENQNGGTSLHIAAYLNNVNIIECLLELGAEVKMKYKPDCQPVMGYVMNDDLMFVGQCNFGIKVLISFLALREESLDDFVDYLKFYVRGENPGSSYFQECKFELDRLKARRFVENVRISFYDFLTRDFLNAREMVKNEEIRNVLDALDYRNEFPCYGILLKKRFERVKKLEDSVEKIVHFIKNYGEVKLPLFIVVKILSYLHAKDFRSFGRALSGSERISHE